MFFKILFFFFLFLNHFYCEELGYIRGKRIQIPLAKSPIVCALSQGGAVIVYSYRKNGDLYGMGLDPAISMTSPEFHVSPPGIFFAQPVVTALEDGTFVVTWIELATQRILIEDAEKNLEEKDSKYVEKDSSKRILGEKKESKSFDDKVRFNAMSFSSEFQQIAEQESLSLNYLFSGGTSTVLNNKNTYIWTRIDLFHSELFVQKFWLDKNSLAPPRKISTGFGSPLVAPLEDGGYVVTWNQWKCVVAKKFDSNDRENEGLIMISDSSYAGEPRITTIKDNGYAIVWIDYEEHELWFWISRENFLEKKSFYKSEAEIKSLAITAMDQGGFIVVWIESDLLYVQRVTSDGNLQGNKIELWPPSPFYLNSISVTTLKGSNDLLIFWNNDEFIDGIHITFLPSA